MGEGLLSSPLVEQQYPAAHQSASREGRVPLLQVVPRTAQAPELKCPKPKQVPNGHLQPTRLELGAVPDCVGCLDFEMLISETFVALLAARPEELEAVTGGALNRLRIFSKADGCALLTVSPDQQEIRLFLASYADGIEPVPLDQNLAPWFPGTSHKPLVEGEPIRVSSVADLPPDRSIERKNWTKMGVRSVLALPVGIGGPVSHLIVLHTVHTERQWPSPFVTHLRIMGEMLVSARQRQQTFVELDDAKECTDLVTGMADAGLWAMDCHTGLFSANDRARTILGYSPAEAITLQRLEATVHPEDRESVYQTIERSQQTREPFDVECRVVRDDGAVRWIASRGRFHFTSAGDPCRITGVSIDITERKSAEQDLRKSYAEIERLKDEFREENSSLESEIPLLHPQGEIAGNSHGIRSVLRLIEQVAPTDSTVLIRGETGTGKELVAQAIHQLSHRQGRPLVKVNCAALPAGLIESELFGREKGAYTGALSRQMGRFETANGSTLFLDEVGELSLEVQAKLLRVLESGEFERLGSSTTIKVNVRVIAATNRDLTEAIREKKFREDLYYRLSVFPVCVPPLRDRPEDIPVLVWSFLEQFCSRMGKKITRVPCKTMDTLQRYSWPGNIRELRNVIEHGAIISTDDSLRIPALTESTPPTELPQTLADGERELILRALERSRWHIKGANGAAALLDINPATLYSRMRKLGIPPHRHMARDGANKATH